MKFSNPNLLPNSRLPDLPVHQMIEKSGEAIYLLGWLVVCNAGYSSDVTLAFVDDQVIPSLFIIFSFEETDTTDDTDDTG